MTDFSDDEAFAAEYVLGTLDADERQAAAARRTREPAFDALVGAWEQRLAPLALATAPIAPPPELLPRVLAALPVTRPASNDNLPIMQRQLRFWRGVAAVASAVAATLAVWTFGRETFVRPPTDQTYVAVLQRGTDQPAFVVSLDLTHRRMSVLPLATTAPEGKSYQVWMIGADGAAPRSMGVIDANTTLKPPVADVDGTVMEKATYAVTVEPLGGSPTGQPTSTPLFVGKLNNTAL